MLRLLAVLSILLTAMPANAISWGRVKLYQVNGPNSVLLFKLENASSSHPACASTQRYAVSLSTPLGQAIASTVLTAAAQGKSIRVIGNGACTAWWDAEDINTVEVEYQY